MVPIYIPHFVRATYLTADEADYCPGNINITTRAPEAFPEQELNSLYSQPRSGPAYICAI